MDKSWINGKDRFGALYKVEVNQFMKMARPSVDSSGRIHCCCKKCKNVILETICNMEDHLFINRFDISYTRWVLHTKNIILWEVGISG